MKLEHLTDTEVAIGDVLFWVSEGRVWTAAVVERSRGRAMLRRTAWRRATNAELLGYPRDGALWVWLRSWGISRPSPSGPSGPPLTDAEQRERGHASVRAWVRKDVRDKLDRLVAERRSSIREVLETLITEASAPKRDGIAALLAFAVDDDQTVEEAEEELRAAGIDVPAFLERVHARLAKAHVGSNGDEKS